MTGATPPRLWAIVGATGTGKSALSLDLVEALAARGRAAEIVNADAMQFYRGMDIGTAKLPVPERRGIPHHLFDVLDPTEEATVAWFQPAARACVADIQARGADAILVGGSGLYVSSAIFDFRFRPRDHALRAALETELETLGVGALFTRLQELDPAAAAAVDARNGRRVVRALELHALGESATGALPEEPTVWQPGTRILGVRAERAELVERLDRRVEGMWADGLLDEVRGLIPRGIERGPTASRAIGYAQALAQLAGRQPQAEAIAETQALTRRYARRQVSWFKRYTDVEWLDAPELTGVELP
ncbi:tRNA (adenosine(37)-N6)-dimethylallyltransferase MiaA [Leucobacter rhizosphaerae]|uniref:tRNA dimethylallyltransferase n=1 Tax=Leucobacter rhizosphaerae TaxID=2932245 RepID=A0ABY4FW73_9MICO|nr:tRNA (adenosine(37)-N6)-dimethylallyltransferase MiaA [Leucobacter rhizosphaerae]UOQ60520.1 tRNA (adenosine(37)-N6)-dimethylallyltransferase MiaA [Leucobacter rhizosphaerae]